MKFKDYLRIIKCKKADITWFYLVIMAVGLIGLIVMIIIIAKSKGKMDEIVETFKNWFS